MAANDAPADDWNAFDAEATAPEQEKDDADDFGNFDEPAATVEDDGDDFGTFDEPIKAQENEELKQEAPSV